MALKLMEPVYNEMPFFQANQVLTVEHLNDLAGFLAQQEHYTRNKLIGSGIVCGLSFKWDSSIAPKASVTIDDGCAVTSAGHLVAYKQPVLPLLYKRNFTRLALYPPFNDPSVIINQPIYELITQVEFDAEKVVPKDFLLDADKANRVLILFLEPEIKSPAKCLDENCDDKGKVYLYTIRPLLVPVSVMNLIIDAPVAKNFFTEPGRGAKGKRSILNGLDYIRLANLFKNNNLQNLNTPADLVTLFKNPCQNADLTTIKTQIDGLITAFPWIFNTQLACLKGEIAALAPTTVGTLFNNNAQAFRNAAANNNYMQYLYDFLRDVVDAYNELFSAVSDMVGECGGNEFIHPHHVMLGRPQTNDTLACYNESKYNEPEFKYRHYFVPSPVMDTQYMLYENVQSLFKRLVRLVAHFKVDLADTTIKVTPGRDYDHLLGERALPYFYLKAQAEKIKAVWNYDATRRNKISRIKGYQLAFTQDQLLDEDTSKNNFYRIEGHIGVVFSTAKTAIDALRNKYNLPFAVANISIQQQTNTVTCAFPDLEEEYNYYRDRVLGYIREIERWLDAFSAFLPNASGEIKMYYNKTYEAIKKMKELLNERCIEKFQYNDYKKAYIAIWDLIFEVYVDAQSTNINSATQALNTAINFFNIIFFRPIYKIWFMYKYRMAVLSQSDVSSLKLLAAKTTGLEHLAGVRRGETFLMVSDQAQGGKIVADFSLPDLPGCGCDCKPSACDGTKRSLVSPLQKPIIMVVDYTNTNENSYGKGKAYLNKAQNVYVLELDSMGFYKADSTIAKDVTIFDDKANIFTRINATWENEKLIIRYKIDGGQNDGGVFKLSYELKGDFDEGKVVGRLFLFVIGKVRPGGGAPSTGQTFGTFVGGKAMTIYPYDKVEMSKVKPEMKFTGVTKRRTIGTDKVDVYTTANGNEMAIYKDRSGLPYIKVINAKNAAVEEVPIILEAGNGSSKDKVTINVVDKKEKIESDVVNGRVLNDDGMPVKDVKVRIGTKEVITNENGEYNLTGVKAGDVITVEKGGYKATNLQVNSKLSTEIKIEKAGLLNIPGLEKVTMPESIEKLASDINFSTLRNFLK